MNLASIETRDSTPAEVTRMRADLPHIRIAVGLCKPVEVSSLYQQLHSYPVGNSGKELAARSHGSKYWISPVRREFLVDLDMLVGIEAEDALLDRVRMGLAGALPRAYGLPFAGDNNLLFDRIELQAESQLASWYSLLPVGASPQEGSCRLTVGINRVDSSQTTMPLFVPSLPEPEPPTEAWVWVPNAP
jgi:CRISPR-associated protein Cas5t